ncbi:MAG: protein kinase, partial [Myxococcales bacterium]|nr:protein kinase [Myxococcales bacterium]
MDPQRESQPTLKEPEGLFGGRTMLGLGADKGRRAFAAPPDDDDMPTPSSGVGDDTRPGRPAARNRSNSERPPGATDAGDTVPDASSEGGDAKASPAHDQRVGTMLAGRFKPASILGRGPFGTVYEAEDRELDAFVAVKVLPRAITADARIMDRIRKQLSKARGVLHPNVGRIFDINRDGDVHFVVMEYVPGHTLADEMQSGMDADDARKRFLQILDALQAIHALGLVHGAVDASHIRIRTDGALKMTSTGLSCELLHGTSFHPEDHHCESPEQKRGEHATVRSDIFAVGRLAKKLLAAAGDPPALKYLHAIADRCMDADPSVRFASIPSLLETVQDAEAAGANRLSSSPVGAPANVHVAASDFAPSDVPAATFGFFVVTLTRMLRRIWRISIPFPYVLLGVTVYVLWSAAHPAPPARGAHPSDDDSFFGWFADSNDDSDAVGVRTLDHPAATKSTERRARATRTGSAESHEGAAPSTAGGDTDALPKDGAYYFGPWAPIQD